jgi:thiamine kinase-like enzyme
MNPGPARDGFFEKFRTSNLLPEAAMEEFFARHAQLAAAYGHRDMASSHNDLFKPDNMLFDGQRLWLVDWEAAFLNDRYADLAVVANMIVTNDAEEHVFLREYFGAEPTAYQLARLFLMQQLAHLFYTMGFLFMGSQGQPVEWSAPVPDYFAFHRRFWAGEIKLTDNPTKILYARVHWERLMHNVNQPRYAESLSIVVAESSGTK